MKLEVGMYVRFKDLTNYIENNDVMIDKITFISEAMNGLDETLQIELEKYQEPILKKDIIGEPSFNIIDLIEVGDYVNGYQVIEEPYNYHDIKFISVDTQDSWSWGKGEMPCTEIKTILTKEQFENNCYKVGED